MLFKFLGKFLDSNEKQLAQLRPVVAEINELEGKFKKLTDEKLGGKSGEFKLRLSREEGLDELLPEAFAAVREWCFIKDGSLNKKPVKVRRCRRRRLYILILCWEKEHIW